VTAAHTVPSEDPTENGVPSVHSPADHSPAGHSIVTGAGKGVSYNLNGQKLGRKGRDTRERILAATVELLAGAEDEPITMSAVARKASLGMTSLYNYFTDFTELLLAVLEPVQVESETAFVAMLRERWADEDLENRCHAFMLAYHDFWARHSRLLHLRNSMADNRDERIMLQRVRSTMPLIDLFAIQMDGDPSVRAHPAMGMATVLWTGIERTVTMATDVIVTNLLGRERRREPEFYLVPEARLMELVIRDTRLAAARG